jgi:hypothetical protein
MAAMSVVVAMRAAMGVIVVMVTMVVCIAVGAI